MTEAWKQYEGQVVDGKFHLRQYLGGSDHSAVFLTEIALQPALKAAIKFIPADAETSGAKISRWQLAAKLSHPNLMQIFDAGRSHLGGRDLLFVVMDFAEENLAQIIPHRALTSEEVQDMLPPVLDVLSYIQTHGLVHNRLRPGNIMAVSDQLKISSDGLHKAGEAEKKSQAPALYDAPETSTGVTPASDIWSLGMTLVEILTQRPLLWDGRGEPVVPEAVPAPFRNIACHCLRQDPQRRWTITEIAAALQSPATGSQKQVAAESSRHSANSVSNKPLAKSRFIGPIVAAVVLLAAIVGVHKLLSHRDHSGQTSSAATPTAVVPSATNPAEAQKSIAPAVATPTQPMQPTQSAPALRHSNPAAKDTASASAQGSVIQQTLPAVSPGARHTIDGRIRVRVRVDVDSSGNVAGAKFESAGPSKYFANKTIEAARNWKFAAPQINGQAVASVWVLRFAIGRTSTTVQSNQTNP